MAMNDLTPKDQPFTGTFASAIAIFLIFLFVPLTIGGAIVLAAEFGDLEKSTESPDDANGFSYTVGEQGQHVAHSQTVVYTATTTRYNEVFTNLPRCWSNAAGDCSTSTSSESDAPLKILLPDIFKGNEELASFHVEWFATNSYQYCSYIDRGMEWSWRLLGNDNQTIASDDERDMTPYIEELSQTTCRNFYSFGKTFTTVEQNELLQNYNDCDNSCNYYLEIYDLERQSPNQVGYDFTQFPLADDGSIRIYSEELKGIKTSVVMNVFPWAITAVMLLVSLASTRLWNPTLGLLKQTGGKK